MSYLVSCHCGRVRLEVDAELGEVVECNCSICQRSGFLHWYVPPESVKYLSEKQGVSTYWWRSATGGQHFCANCGIAVVRISTQYPPPVSINARCIEGIDVASLTIRQFAAGTPTDLCATAVPAGTPAPPLTQTEAPLVRPAAGIAAMSTMSSRARSASWISSIVTVVPCA